MQIYYNMRFGYIVCAVAAMRGGEARVVLDPVTVLRPEAAELALGNAVRSGLERSRAAAPADPAAERYKFWRVSGIRSYERFSRQFLCLDIVVNGPALQIIPLENDRDGGYSHPDNGFCLDLPADLPAAELGEAVNMVLARQCRLAGCCGSAYEPEWDMRDMPQQVTDDPMEWERTGAGQEKHMFLRTGLVLTGLAAIPIWWHIYEAWKYMSFAGFGSLFVLFFMLPGFLGLAAEAVLFLCAMKWGKRLYAAAGHILQIICGIPATYFFCLAPDFFWALSVYTVLMAFGAVGLLRLLFTCRR